MIFNNSDVLLYLARFVIIDLCIRNVLTEKENYGLLHKCFNNKVTVSLGERLESDVSKMNLTELRALITQNVAANIVDCLCNNICGNDCNIKILLNSNKIQTNHLLCGLFLMKMDPKIQKQQLLNITESEH